MKIALLEVRSKRKECINKDFMGGYGWAFNAGRSLRARMINFVKKRGETLPIMSLGYLASIFADRGHKVIYAENEIPDADIVFLQSSMVDYRYEIEWAGKIKKTGTTVGFIGPFSSVKPDLFLGDADFVIKGEPEDAAVRIAGGFEPRGVIESAVIDNLDMFPFPNWKIFPYSRYSYFPALKERPFLPILSSRGCPYTCNYCPYLIVYKWRERSPENVLKEVEYLIDSFGIKAFLFRDPIFTFNRARTIEIAQALINKNYRLKWACETRLDHLDKELLKLLYDAGLRVINVGIESSSEDIIRKSSRKPVEIRHQEEMLSYCDELGIRITAFYMFGMPDDTRESIAATMEYAKRLNTHVAQFFVFTPFPGTCYFDKILPDIIQDDWEKFDCYTPCIRHRNITPCDILELKEKAFVSYYFRMNWFRSFFRRVFRDIFHT